MQKNLHDLCMLLYHASEDIVTKDHAGFLVEGPNSGPRIWALPISWVQTTMGPYLGLWGFIRYIICIQGPQEKVPYRGPKVATLDSVSTIKHIAEQKHGDKAQKSAQRLNRTSNTSTYIVLTLAQKYSLWRPPFGPKRIPHTYMDL